MENKELEQVITRIRESKKYRSMELPRETIADLLDLELPRHKKQSDAIRAVRSKLHNITAPYLDALDYDQAMQKLETIFSSKPAQGLEDLYMEFLLAHKSTAERMPYMHAFYDFIFSNIRERPSILDLACGMNPFTIPLVERPHNLTYHAYDIHKPRIQLIQRLFTGAGINGSAECRDILVQPPKKKVNAAFLFKEAHRMEKRRSGATRDLIASLQVSHLFISLPTRTLNGKFNLRDRMRQLVINAIKGVGKIVEEKTFAAELIFHIRMENG